MNVQAIHHQVPFNSIRVTCDQLLNMVEIVCLGAGIPHAGFGDLACRHIAHWQLTSGYRDEYTRASRRSRLPGRISWIGAFLSSAWMPVISSMEIVRSPCSARSIALRYTWQMSLTFSSKSGSGGTQPVLRGVWFQISFCHQSAHVARGNAPYNPLFDHFRSQFS